MRILQRSVDRAIRNAHFVLWYSAASENASVQQAELTAQLDQRQAEIQQLCSEIDQIVSLRGYVALALSYVHGNLFVLATLMLPMRTTTRCRSRSILRYSNTVKDYLDLFTHPFDLLGAQACELEMARASLEARQAEIEQLKASIAAAQS